MTTRKKVTKKATTKRASAASTRRVNASRTAKKTAKKTVTRQHRKPVEEVGTHDVGKNVVAYVSQYKPVEKIGGKILSANWIGSSFNCGMITGQVLDPSTWQVGKSVFGSDLTRTFASKTILRHHADKFTDDGKRIKFSKTGLEFIRARALGIADIATPPPLINAMITALKTGKAPKHSGLDHLTFAAIK